MKLSNYQGERKAGDQIPNFSFIDANVLGFNSSVLWRDTGQVLPVMGLFHIS